MKLYTNKELLNLAKKGKYAVGLGPGRESIRQTVQSKMKLFGSSGKIL